MVKKLWEIIKSPFVWIKKQWDKFQDWCATWMPGLKTRIVAGLGLLGSAAGFAQGWVSGLPLDHFMTATQVVMVSAVLFTIAYWTRALTDRV